VEDTLQRRSESDASDDEEDEPAPPPDACHRHFDPYAEGLAAGTVCKSEAQHVSGFRKRSAGRLGVGRPPFIEPVGAQREAFFEQRLCLGLPWYCTGKPMAVVAPDGASTTMLWRFQWDPPPPDQLDGADLQPHCLELSSACATVSFETTAADIERDICRPEHSLVCGCCLGEEAGSICSSCRFSVGFHRCERALPGQLLWRKGTLHGGSSDVDVARVIFNLHRKGAVP
jgi:hypothetical protein